MSLKPSKENFGYYALGIIIILLVVLGTCVRVPKPVEKIEPLKNKVKESVKKGEVLKKKEAKADSTRIVYIDRWHKAKPTLHDSIFLPCQELIIICDSVIIADSTEIGILKAQLQNKDTTIADLFDVVKQDSIDIRGLNKEVRKQKWLRRAITTGFILYEGAKAAAPFIKP